MTDLGNIHKTTHWPPQSNWHCLAAWGQKLAPTHDHLPTIPTYLHAIYHTHGPRYVAEAYKTTLLENEENTNSNALLEMILLHQVVPPSSASIGRFRDIRGFELGK